MTPAASYYDAELSTVRFRVAEGAPPSPPSAPDPESAIPILRAIFENLDADREHFVILALDAKNTARGFKATATGGSSHSVVDPRTVYRDALALGANALILAHNHPSGDPEPSPDDVTTTRRLVDAGKILGVPVRDHLILAGTRYVSLMRRGLM